MRAPSPSRRRLLASGLAASIASVAGCLGSLDGSASTDDDDGERSLSLRLSSLDGSLRDRYVVDLAEQPPPWSEAAFEAALGGESYTTQHRRPFYSTPSDPTYTERDGTYYRLGSVVVDEVTTTHPVLRLRATDGGNGSTPAGVQHDELPEADQRAVEIAQKATRARGNEGGVPWGLVQRGGYVYRREDAVEASRLLADDGPSHVTYRDDRYRVEVARERFHEAVYRPTVEPVTDDPERMEAALRAKFVRAQVDRSALSTDARDVLRRARGDGYSESHPYSDAFQAVLRALHERAYVDGNVEKDAFARADGPDLVLYDGRYYDYHLRFTASEE